MPIHQCLQGSCGLLVTQEAEPKELAGQGVQPTEGHPHSMHMLCTILTVQVHKHVYTHMYKHTHK